MLPSMLANVAKRAPDLAIVMADSSFICVIKSMACEAIVDSMPEDYHFCM